MNNVELYIDIFREYIYFVIYITWNLIITFNELIVTLLTFTYISQYLQNISKLFVGKRLF